MPQDHYCKMCGTKVPPFRGIRLFWRQQPPLYFDRESCFWQWAEKQYEMEHRNRGE